MWGPASAQLWERVKFGPRPDRGYDCRHTELASWGVIPLSAEEAEAVRGKPLERPLTDRHIRGTFAAVSSVAGWIASARIDPADPKAIELVDTFAGILEDMLRGLRGALHAPAAGDSPPS